MVAVHVVREPPPDWSELVFAGGLLVVTQVEALVPFVQHARALLGEAFSATRLLESQQQLGEEDFTRRITGVRATFRDDVRARALLGPVLGRFGLDPARTFWDRVNLRIVPSGSLPRHAADLVLGAHRDTWGSNVYAQINWWLPLMDVTAERTIRFYPRHWSVPVPNTSAEWDLEELRRQRRAKEPVSVPMVPAPLSPPDPADAVELVIEPGAVLLFSGAHLHATVPNTSGAPRYSLELRTVALDDVLAGRGAPTVDGAAPRVPWEWFRRVDDDTPLSTALADG